MASTISPGTMPQTKEPPVMSERIQNTADISVIVIYFIVVLAVGLWSMAKSNRGTVGGFFLAGRDVSWWPCSACKMGASLFASNIGSNHFVGLAGTGAASGIATAAVEWNALLMVLVLRWIFVPIYIKVMTMPEYLRKRFGGQRLQIYLSVLSLFIMVAIQISSSIFSGAIFIQLALGLDLAVFILLAITAFYTVAGGGLASVIYTDTIQAFIMLIGSLILMGFAFAEVGSYENFTEKYMNVIPSVIKGDNLTIRLIFGMTILAIWYWCADQLLSCTHKCIFCDTSIDFSKLTIVICSLLELASPCVQMFPSLEEVQGFWNDNNLTYLAPSNPMKDNHLSPGCLRTCFSLFENTRNPKLDHCWMKLLLLLLLLLSILSGLLKIFSHPSIYVLLFVATLSTKICFPHPNINGLQAWLLKLFAMVLITISILWVPLVQSSQNGQIFHYMASFSSYTGPPVGALFMLAIFCKRVNEQGAFWGLMVGLVIGLIRMIAEFIYGTGSCLAPSDCPTIICGVHYMYFAIILFSVSVLVILGISYLTKPIPDVHVALYRLCWSLWNNTEKRIDLDAKEESHEDVDSAPEEEDSQQSRGCLKRACSLFCGVQNTEPKMSKEEEEALREKFTDTSEKPLWRNVVNINAIILLAVAVFIHAYFA
ncbi:low affinity sodium-glucose cotransporter [Sigmodon hispidus]